MKPWNFTYDIKSCDVFASFDFACLYGNFTVFSLIDFMMQNKQNILTLSQNI